jgi:TPR repeat protein
MRPTSFVSMLQTILEKLKPKTLFRDLQYISVFVQQETLNKTERGNALTDFGLAALAYKAGIAQAMVDVADRVFAQGSSRPTSTAESLSLLEPKYADASTFLLIAAREGNAVAQREVAGLYLTHVEMKQVISLPLTFSGETFKKENEWQKKAHEERRISSQAMCLALHWMQQAAANGDKIAKEKLKKREEGISLR